MDATGRDEHPAGVQGQPGTGLLHRERRPFVQAFGHPRGEGRREMLHHQHRCGKICGKRGDNGLKSPRAACGTGDHDHSVLPRAAFATGGVPEPCPWPPAGLVNAVTLCSGRLPDLLRQLCNETTHCGSPARGGFESEVDSAQLQRLDGDRGALVVGASTPEGAREAYEKYLARHAEEFEAQGVETSSHVRSGKPVDEILRAALDLRCDIIAMAIRAIVASSPARMPAAWPRRSCGGRGSPSCSWLKVNPLPRPPTTSRPEAPPGRSGSAASSSGQQPWFPSSRQ